jgi:hypothetical protein
MKKKYLLLLAVGFVITLSMQGQITTHELPVSFKKDIPLLERNTKSVKVMPTINLEKIQQEDEEDKANGMPPPLGVASRYVELKARLLPCIQKYFHHKLLVKLRLSYFPYVFYFSACSVLQGRSLAFSST